MDHNEIHGQRGVLATDWHTVQCHLCGKWYSHLGSHVTKTHGLSAHEYKEIAGLNATAGLISPELAEKRRAAVGHLREYDEQHRQRMHAMSAGERRENQGGRKPRLQTLLDPEHQRRVRMFIQAGQDGLARAREDGTYSPPQPPSAEDTKKGQRKLARMREDPEFQKLMSRRISEGKGGARMETRACRWCQSPFEIRASSRRQTCSSDCNKLLRAEITRNQQDVMRAGREQKPRNT